ncbi:hypothetical protein PV325_009239 [Microctonus aethiopoides]|uniref:N-acetyllactosaminide beta-1,3-N-acetylglucosaminyltransferase n=1 Tax=Microctonus aethiopoides TaxID=144406 RepID=A0AA39FUU7_9HYME|nr:hypothetical protein PV325_009239 [Microctonus aethiopoides]KAK0175951.1 hypothetical protein PV328_000140 [Microctonus aethiopoides]
MSSPEAGEKSPYRILPFIIRGGIKSPNDKPLPKITLCTHATADKVYHVVDIVKKWEGPVSFSVFAPGNDARIAVDMLDRACRCEPEMYKLSVHLIFLTADHLPTTVINDKSQSKGDCAAWDLQWNDVDTERTRHRLIYPINVARNVARNLATTSRVLVSDVELLPSDKLASGFMEMIHGRPPRFGLVFVVPVFEIEQHQRPPTNKRELMNAITNGLAVYFHKYICLHCQRFPGMTRWMLRPDPSRVRPLIVTRREYPHHRWEPLYIGTREDPLYNEEMSWEGRQDKMAQMLEMCLMNYRLIILDGAFLVHSPGIKRKVSKLNLLKNNLQQNYEMQNTRLYQIITRRLLKQYPVNRRCRQ